jgi:Tfp pilus assembly protein PilO
MSKTKAWAFSALAAIALVFAAGWYFAISPQHAKVSKLHSAGVSQQSTNQQLSLKLQTLQRQQAQVPAQLAQIAAAHDRVPSNAGLPAYMRRLVADAAAAHVELVSVAPADAALVKLATPKPSPAAPAAAGTATPPVRATTAAPAAPPLAQIAVSIHVVGDYFAIQQFISKLEAENRITVVSGLDFKPGQLPAPPVNATGPAGVAGPDWHTLDATITAAIFTSQDVIQGVAGATAPPGATTAPKLTPSPQPSSTSVTK